MILLSSVWDGPNISSFFFSFKEEILGPSNQSLCITHFVCHAVLCAAIRSGSTCQWPFWILAFACTVALNCQNTSQNASYAKNAENLTRSEYFFDGRKVSEAVCKHD